MKANETCCICLRQDRKCCIEETDENGIYYKTKLKSIVPEIDWNSSHYLCGTCLHHLEIAYDFKQLCLDNLLTLNRESDGDDFPIHSDSGQSHIDSDDDKNAIFKSRVFANFENDKYLISIDNVHKELIDEGRSNMEIFPQIDSPQKINITLKQNQHVGKSTTFNCKSCEETFERKYDLTKHQRLHKNHFCNVCQKSYKRKCLLEQHVMRNHTEKNNWKHQCCYCNEVFPTKMFLISHSKKRHKTNDILICFHCNERFVDKNMLLDHIIAIHQKNGYRLESDDIANNSEKINEFQSVQYGVCNIATVINNETCLKDASNKMEATEKRTCRTFSCETCQAVFYSSVKLVYHCVHQHNVDAKLVRPFACDLCEKRFSTSAILIEHRRYHLKERQNICSFCGKGFITKNDLNCHEFIHLNKRSFKCEICLKGFNTQKNLRTHRIVKHADPMTWKHCCTICNKRFAILSNYKVHVRRHMGDKQFCCHLCDKKFVNKDELRQHTESHSNIREFKCEYCDKEYKKKRVYEIHLTKNHGIGNAKVPKREKKHTCHLCPKSYFDKSKLNKHLLSHSGIKPFVCNICDKKFTDNYYMKQHMEKCHNSMCTVTSDSTRV